MAVNQRLLLKNALMERFAIHADYHIKGLLDMSFKRIPTKKAIHVMSRDILDILLFPLNLPNSLHEELADLLYSPIDDHFQYVYASDPNFSNLTQAQLPVDLKGVTSTPCLEGHETPSAIASQHVFPVFENGKPVGLVRFDLEANINTGSPAYCNGPPSLSDSDS